VETGLILGIAIVLAVYVAANLGANDVANSFATSVGSQAITLAQAIAIAGIMEFIGAVWLGSRVSQTLAADIVVPDLSLAPKIFITGMLSVMLACGIWLQIATSLGLPVASSHAIVGALAGFGWVAVGPQAIHWSQLAVISLTWLVVPLASALVAAALYGLFRTWILTHPFPQKQWAEWIPWLSALMCGIFGWLGFSSSSAAIPIAGMGKQIPIHDWYLLLWLVATVGLTWWNWSANNNIAGGIEAKFARLQILSASFVAFAHGSNDVGNAIAPLAAIAHLLHSPNTATSNFTVPIWILLVGGGSLVVGLAIWGKRVIATVGTEIIPLQPSSGFCAEMATATTVLLASQAGLPVSTSHALVGGVVGIAIVQGVKSLSYRPLRRIAWAWLGTVPAAILLGAVIFRLLQLAFPN
jgi:PiT family inorganic phosphate transporter